jgi:hypothetical protein
MLQRKPRAEGSFDAGRSSIARWRTSVSTINLRLLRWHGQSTQRLRPGIGCRYLEFRLSITFAWFRYSRRFFSSATLQHGHSGRHSRSRVASNLTFTSPRSPFSLGSRHAACRQVFRLTDANSGPSRRSATLPQFVTPRLSSQSRSLRRGLTLHEIKLDGYRMAAHIDNGRVNPSGLGRLGRQISSAIAALTGLNVKTLSRRGTLRRR